MKGIFDEPLSYRWRDGGGNFPHFRVLITLSSTGWYKIDPENKLSASFPLFILLDRSVPANLSSARDGALSPFTAAADRSHFRRLSGRIFSTLSPFQTTTPAFSSDHFLGRSAVNTSMPTTLTASKRRGPTSERRARSPPRSTPSGG